MIRRATVRDAEPYQHLHKPRGGKLCAVVGGQSVSAPATPRRQPLQDRLLYGRQRLFRATTMRKIPTHDLPRAAVDHADQICPTYGRSRPDLGHIRLPDLIRLCCFHTSPLLLPSGSQASGANQQAPLTHHPQHSFAIHPKSFLATQPPGHAAIPICGPFSTGRNDLLIVGSLGSTPSWLLSVVQTRPADGQRLGHHRRCIPLFDQNSGLGVNFTAAHSPTTFFRISISNDLRPRVRSNCRMRRSFSVSAAAVLSPPSAAFAPCSASSFQR